MFFVVSFAAVHCTHEFVWQILYLHTPRIGYIREAYFWRLARVHQDPCPSTHTIYRWILEIQNSYGQFSVALMPQYNESQLMQSIWYNTLKRFQNWKKYKISLKKMHFQTDNAKTHTAAATQNFLASWNVNLFKQSPYSHDLNILDRFLFWQVKSDLRGKIIVANMTRKKAIQKIALYWAS